MSKELTVVSPEGLEIANSYLQIGNIEGVCKQLNVQQNVVVEWLNKREVKKYIDTVYYDLGYRNRNNIAELLDKIIASKLEEAEVSEIYSNKDLADLMMMAHKMRQDDMKMAIEAEKVAGTKIRNQTNVQINDGSVLGDSNYAKLIQGIFDGEKNK